MLLIDTIECKAHHTWDCPTSAADWLSEASERSFERKAKDNAKRHVSQIFRGSRLRDETTAGRYCHMPLISLSTYT